MEDPAANKLSFDERLGLLVDAEWTARKNNRLKRLIYRADFPISGACVEDIEYRSDRKDENNLLLLFRVCLTGPWYGAFQIQTFHFVTHKSPCLLINIAVK
jgi:hypothetical protein